MSDRFIIIEGSDSGHCCFAYSVIDTSKGKHSYSIGKTTKEKWNCCVCECYEEDDAKQIADALNAFFKVC